MPTDLCVVSTVQAQQNHLLHSSLGVQELSLKDQGCITAPMLAASTGNNLKTLDHDGTMLKIKARMLTVWSGSSQASQGLTAHTSATI